MANVNDLNPVNMVTSLLPGSSMSDIIPSYSFSVLLDNIAFGFTKITNLAGTAEIETIVSGGTNDSPIILRKPKRNPDMLVLEKGLYTSTRDVMFSQFWAGRKISTISINVLRNGKTCRMFYVNNGIIVKREFSPMDALESAVLLESMQIAHSGLTEIPLPFGL